MEPESQSQGQGPPFAPGPLPGLGVNSSTLAPLPPPPSPSERQRMVSTPSPQVHAPWEYPLPNTLMKSSQSTRASYSENSGFHYNSLNVESGGWGEWQLKVCGGGVL